MNTSLLTLRPAAPPPHHPSPQHGRLPKPALDALEEAAASLGQACADVPTTDARALARLGASLEQLGRLMVKGDGDRD